MSDIDPSLPPRATLRQAFHHYAASAAIYGSILLVFTVSPRFRELLHVEFNGRSITQLYGIAYLLYLTLSPLIFFIVRPRSLWVSKNLMITGYLKRLILAFFAQSGPRSADFWRPTWQEKNALALLLIKVFYGPIMLSCVATSYYEVKDYIKWASHAGSLLNRLDLWYSLFVTAVFGIDVVLFSIGYHTEAGLFKNKLRFAETNLLHILVCIICYPPFNQATTAFFGPSNYSPGILFRGNLAHPATWVFRGIAVFFLLILISSSLSLFTKASNLTNRGIVDWGPYRIVRHPGYLAKNLFWITTLTPALIPLTADPKFTWGGYLLSSAIIIWGIIGWATIYFLRSITEERFLMQDPDYVAYCKKVKYRFIPGVY